MRIGIDGFEANIKNRVGIGIYAYQLLSHIYQLDSKNEYLIYLPNLPLSDMPKERKNWHYIIGRQMSLWTITQLPLLIKNSSPDIFFSPTHYLPWFVSIPKIMSIMDLSYLHFPGMFRKKDYIQLKYLGFISIKRARKILTISEFTKRELIKFYNYAPEDIVVTYPGLSKFNQNNFDENKNILTKLGIKGKFILFVGTLQPRKNLSRLIAAFNHIKNDNLNLVIVGKKGWLYKSIFQNALHAEKSNKIFFLDYIDNNDLNMLYKFAICFVCPSLYEGFGIPVLEAMSYGCPVVVSNTSSLPEVAGKAGIYVDPFKIQDIARGINKALQLKISERENLVQTGYQQIKKFNWKNCTLKTISVFEEFSKLNER